MEALSENNDHLALTKRSILWKLETTLEPVTSISLGLVDGQLSGDLTQTLCTVIEAIFIHGLRDAFFLKGSRHSNKPSPNFWPFVSKYTHRSIKTQISTLNQIHSEIGRARAWVRIVLNEYSLDHYISLFAKDTKQMNQFYAEGAFLRDSECVSALDTHFKRLNGLRIAAPTNSSLLNTWTPSPLAMAGLIKTTSPVGGVFAPQSAAVPLDVPSSISPSFTGRGFKVGSSSPSAASSSVLLPDDAAGVIASGEQQIVAEFGMSADQLLFEEADQCDEDQIPAEEHQQQQTSSTAAMADDLESVYSHPSMMEDHHQQPPLTTTNPFGMFDYHYQQQRRQNVHSPFPTIHHSSNNNNKWLMAALPDEELSTEVIVHRKATHRHRRRTVSKSSGGGDSDTSSAAAGDNASWSRCHSNANMHTFAESLVEPAEESLPMTVTNIENEPRERLIGGIEHAEEEAPVFEEETPALMALRQSITMEAKTTTTALDITQQQASSPPPLGTSLQDELLLAGVVPEKDDDGDEFVVKELARKKFSATEEPRMVRHNLLNNSHKSVDPSGKVSFSYSTDSMDELLLHEPNSGGMPATFDEALRDFLSREAQKRRRNRARTSSSTTNVRLFSECSSSSAGGAAPSHPTTPSSSQQQQQQQSTTLLSSSMTRMSAQSPTGCSFGHSAGGGGGTKRGSAATMTAFLFRAKELPSMPFKREERNKCPADSEEELIVLPLPPSLADGSSAAVAGGDEPYRLPRRLHRLTQIPHELGLDAQEFRCAACRRNIGASFGPFNACALNGRYYCVGHCIRASGAADDEATLIPARVVYNADFRPRTVSRESRLLLRSIVDKPFMRLDMLNPHIYAHCAMLRKVRDLRLKFSLFVLYLSSCKDSIAEDAKRRIWPHKHWHEDIHLYSISDFESVANGTMERRLNSLINFAQCHVQSCTICLQKGFFCELCSATDQPIYPFQTEITFRCPNCASVFHKTCAQKAGLDDGTDHANSITTVNQRQHNCCPKCLRRAKYYASTVSNNNPSSSLASSISNK